MSNLPLRVGITGTGVRSADHAATLQKEPRTKLVAVHDPLPEARERFAHEHEVETTCERFDELLEHVDVVVLASPQQYHAPQACEALAQGIHVLSEVPAAVSIEQAQALVSAARTSQARYGMHRTSAGFPHLVARELVRAGELGELFYGENDYVHNVRGELIGPDGKPSWKRFWWVGRDGNTYPTHSLGSMLSWFDDRIVAVNCAGAGRHSDYELQSTTILLCRTAKGSLIRVRFEWLSNIPPQFKWAIHGSRGGYFLEVAREQVTSGIYIVCKSPADKWEPIETYATGRFPSRYARPPVDVDQYSLGSPDAWMLQDFIDSILTGEEFDVDVYRALDMTLPGVISESPIAQGSCWAHVPNPRFFTSGIGADVGDRDTMA
jgi:predicted dehydrogenase